MWNSPLILTQVFSLCSFFCWDSLEEKKQGHFKDKIMCKNVVGGGWGVVAVPLGSIRPQEARAKDLGGPNAKQI